MPRCLCSASTFLMVIGVTVTCFGQKHTWQYENGKWPQVNEVIPQPVSNPVLDQAEQLLVAGDTQGARKMLLAWEHVNKDSPVRDRCIYLIAQSYYKEDDRILAFYYLDEVMDEYPESRLFQPALELQYSIADDYLNGHKRRFFNFPILPAEDEAIEMLYRIQQRAPGSALAEKCLLRTADYYYNSGQFDFAADAYAAYVRSYPRGASVERARLRQAFATLAQFRGLLFDPTPLIDARQQLLDFSRTYPNAATDEDTAGFIDRIDSAFAGKLLATADFYQRTGEVKASAYYLQFLIETYGESPEAAEARHRLRSFPAWATSPPTPPIEGGYAPVLEANENGGR
ncbi:MAG TPA: outer membrane protein assembly factor BamD [Tepidisphaeraceae bacterium]|nr:outer membrane protein assembly factor BamD [Tepidisphaeraceae bacterium]